MADSESQRSTFTTGDVLRKLRLASGNEGDRESDKEHPDCTEQDAAAQGWLVSDSDSESDSVTSDTAVHRGQRGTPAGFSSPTDVTGSAVCHSSDSDDSTLSAAVRGRTRSRRGRLQGSRLPLSAASVARGRTGRGRMSRGNK